MSEELKKFYKAKSHPTKGVLFDYDDDGNLIERNKEGTTIKTIPLPRYRPPTMEEFDEMEKKRQENIAIANKEFEDARMQLHEEYKKPNRLDSNVIRLNRLVTEADHKLQAIRSPLKFVLKEEGVQIRRLDFTQLNETRVFPYDIAIMETNPFQLQEQYVREGEQAQKPMVSVAEATQAVTQAKAATVILFSEPDTNEYGFLSLSWAVQLEFNATMYHSAKQAIAAELAKSFNDQDHLATIMMTETAEAVQYKIEDVPGDKDANEVKWNDVMKKLLHDVNLIKFTQYPELATKLLVTKDAVLGAYEANDNLIGIGISLDTIQSRDPVQWTGQNLLGKALMEVRETIRQNQLALAQQQPQLDQKIQRPKRKLRVSASSLAADDTVPSDIAVPEAVPMAVPMAVKRSGRKPRVTSYIEAQQSEEVPQQVEFDEVIE
jgi:ribA/ribD-fused uncharacterized protein